MSKRKTAPTKAAQPVPAESARPADLIQIPKVFEPPKFDSRNYPPDDLPEVTQDELRAIKEKGEPSAEEVELVLREDTRAKRKIGYFESLKEDMRRSDAEARQASAGATGRIAGIDDWARQGVKIQSIRRHGGRETGKLRRSIGDETRGKVLAERDRLIKAKTDKTPREFAGIIAGKIGRSPSQVRRILAAQKKRA